MSKKTYIWNILPIFAMPWSVAMDFGTPKWFRIAEACMEHVCLVQRGRKKNKLATLAVSVDAQPLEVRQCYFIPINILLVVWNIFYFSIYWECDHPNWLSYFSEGLKPPTIYIYIYILSYHYLWVNDRPHCDLSGNMVYKRSHHQMALSILTRLIRTYYPRIMPIIAHYSHSMS